VKVDVPIVGDVDNVLDRAAMIKEIKADPRKPDAEALAAWWKQIERVARRTASSTTALGELIKPQYVVETLWKLTKGDAFITSDVGQHQMWAAQFYKFDKPNRWINSGGLGTMGVGLPRRWACSSRIRMPPCHLRHRRGSASRCASRSCPPACSTGCRSRS
jgi:acetolactate synthase I/II/III large subunit